MRLNDEQQERLRAKLRELDAQNRPCGLCGEQLWEISDTVFELREFFGGDVVLVTGSTGSGIYPVIAITCGNCGNSTFLNALVAGVVKPDEIQWRGDDDG